MTFVGTAVNHQMLALLGHHQQAAIRGKYRRTTQLRTNCLDLIVFDPDDGPRLATELPSPFFYGRGLSKESIEADRKGSFLLIPGEYLFFQWRPKNEPELREGLEWFARESWWEDQKADGPYIVRRILEDKALATQVLRAIAR